MTRERSLTSESSGLQPVMDAGASPAASTIAEAATAQAKKELAEEKFREAVEAEKLRLKARKTWFPWIINITIKRR